MIRKFELCSLRLVGFGNAKTLTNAVVTDNLAENDQIHGFNE